MPKIDKAISVIKNPMVNVRTLARRTEFVGENEVMTVRENDALQGHSVKCLFSIQNYRVKATFYIYLAI